MGVTECLPREQVSKGEVSLGILAPHSPPDPLHSQLILPHCYPHTHFLNHDFHLLLLVTSLSQNHRVTHDHHDPVPHHPGLWVHVFCSSHMRPQP
jgi:hypothetical protein